VISSLLQETSPAVHVWSNFQSVRSYKSRGSSAHTFVIEPRDPKVYALKFKCASLEEKEKWLVAITEQLALTSKIWSSAQPISKQSATTTCRNLISKKSTIILENQIMPVSVLDKWLDQLEIMDTGNRKRYQDSQSTATKRYSTCSGSSSNSGRKYNRRGSQPSIHNRHDNSKIIMHRILPTY
jgi:hypothetical protein